MTILALIVVWCAVSSLLALAAAAFFRVGRGPDRYGTGVLTTAGGSRGRDAELHVSILA